MRFIVIIIRCGLSWSEPKKLDNSQDKLFKQPKGLAVCAEHAAGLCVCAVPLWCGNSRICLYFRGKMPWFLPWLPWFIRFRYSITQHGANERLKEEFQECVFALVTELSTLFSLSSLFFPDHGLLFRYSFFARSHWTSANRSFLPVSEADLAAVPYCLVLGAQQQGLPGLRSDRYTPGPWSFTSNLVTVSLYRVFLLASFQLRVFRTPVCSVCSLLTLALKAPRPLDSISYCLMDGVQFNWIGDFLTLF